MASDFVAVLNPVTGRVEWAVTTTRTPPAGEEDGDGTIAAAAAAVEGSRLEGDGDDGVGAELLASAYGDMLQDSERNRLYDAAITAAVARFSAVHGRPPRVLDIGTGTGLLAMMAVRAGASPGEVTACEGFEPMARLAARVLADNRMTDAVRVVPKHSTVMAAPPPDRKAELVVSEILDTELIGEGVLGTLRHALTELAADGAAVIPAGATVRGVLVESELLRGWHRPGPPWSVGGAAEPPPGRMVDVQADALESAITVLCDPFDALRFDFSTPPATHGGTELVVTPTAAGIADAVLLWWDAHLDADHRLSTAPRWLDDRPGRSWRDHWRQAVYLLPGPPTAVSPAAPLAVGCGHDDYELWFWLGKVAPRAAAAAGRARLGPPWSLWPPTRMGALNDPERRARVEGWARAACAAVGPGQVIVSVGDGSIPAIAAAAAGGVGRLHGVPRPVFSFEPNEVSRRYTAELLPQLGLRQDVKLLEVTTLDKVTQDMLGGCTVGAIIAEPYFLSTLLPWHVLQLWHAREALRPVLAPAATMLPRTITLVVACVQFSHLHQTQAAVGRVAGFDLGAYDTATAPYTGSIGPVALWEYTFATLSAPKIALTFDLMTVATDRTAVVRLPVVAAGRWNAVVCWAAYSDDGEISAAELATGPPTDPHADRAAVQFVPETTVEASDAVDLHIEFAAGTCDVTWRATHSGGAMRCGDNER